MLQDQTVRLWDLRKLSAHGEVQAPVTYKGHKEPLGGLAVHGNDVISWAGSCIGLISLSVGSPFTRQLLVASQNMSHLQFRTCCIPGIRLHVG